MTLTLRTENTGKGKRNLSTKKRHKTALAAQKL